MAVVLAVLIDGVLAAAAEAEETQPIRRVGITCEAFVDWKATANLCANVFFWRSFGFEYSFGLFFLPSFIFLGEVSRLPGTDLPLPVTR